MKAFTVCTSHAAALRRDNVDTDLIIRIERIAKLKRGEFASWAFEMIRYLPDGSEDPDFVLNRKPFRDAQVLLGGANFGCGSSREMAVWALEEFGIRCVIAESYGDIFYSNCFQNGVLAITLSRQQVAALSDYAESGRMMTVDLERCVITADGMEPVAFDMPDQLRDALLRGLDPIDQSLLLSPQIARFQQQDRIARPWVYRDAWQDTQTV